MARHVIWGTPNRTKHYVIPRKAYALVFPALAVAGTLLGLFALAQLVGFRAPISPGDVSSKHAMYDERCEECHVPLQGASDIRCRRCHDPASGGRFTNSAHVFFGSLDAARAAAAPTVACARCHVEHQGAESVLGVVDEGHCTGCHGDSAQLDAAFSDFDDHIEFAVLRNDGRHAPGILFSHLTHVTGANGKPAYLARDRGLKTPEQTCGECHTLVAGGAEFRAVSYDAHCGECHSGDLKMDPVPSDECVSASALEFAIPETVFLEWNLRESDFEEIDGETQKLSLIHPEPWVLYNIRKLWRELDPSGFAAHRAALQARQSQLQRRLDLTAPNAAGEPGQLEERQATLEAELAYLDQRLSAPMKARIAGLDRLDEVTAAVTGPAPDRAGDIARRASALQQEGVEPEPLTQAFVDERKAELLVVLDAIEQSSPGRKGQVDELRQRVEQLEAGATSSDLLTRTRLQRIDALRGVEDERALRSSGTAPPSETLLSAERQAIASALRRVMLELALLDALPQPDDSPSAEGIARKTAALDALAKGCRNCHQISPIGAFSPVAAAEPALWRATFTHRAHLTLGESCASCHVGESDESPWSIETSSDATQLNFRGVASCRECHRSGGTPRDCQKCHNYHPPARP